MSWLWRAALVVLLLLGAIFVVVEALGLPLLADPTPWFGTGAAPAVVGTALLVADVVLPVPSSVVMVAYGSLYGVAAGTALSALGGVGAALLGYAVGRGGSPLLRRLAPTGGQDAARDLLRRYGLLAVTLTRPVPLLAETTVVVAGASGALRPWQVALAAFAGSLPASVLYAVAGALAVRGAWWWLPALLTLATLVVWGASRLLGRRLVASARRH